jgi:hypothetical protein
MMNESFANVLTALKLHWPHHAIAMDPVGCSEDSTKAPNDACTHYISDAIKLKLGPVKQLEKSYY